MVEHTNNDNGFDIDKSVTRNRGPVATTLVEKLKLRAVSDANCVGFDFLSYSNDGDSRTDSLSYADLFAKAQAVAATVQNNCIKGDRILILCPPGLNYVVSFYGCLMAGMVAVPAYPPHNAKQMAGLETIMADAGATCILVQQEMQNQLQDWASTRHTLPQIILIDQIDLAARLSWVDPNVQPDDLAFLQYTSGSTGLPKGVMISHANVVDNAHRIVEVVNIESGSKGCVWVPPHHDMGLICGLIVPIVTGSPVILMSPASFLQRPFRWLEAVDRYRATHICAPNFGYQMCVDATYETEFADLDLSCLKSVVSGGEPTRYSTLRSFEECFAPIGFRIETFQQVLGMAETVLLTTGSREQAGPKLLPVDPRSINAGTLVVKRSEVGKQSKFIGDRTVEMISCGSVISNHELLIVDPHSRQVCRDGSIGEVWLSGPSIAGGYWNEPEATETTFGATIADDPGDKRYLRSGDLGAIVNGELFLCGRHKDMIIIHGQNHYAHDIERAAAGASDYLDPDRTIAVGVKAQGREQLLLLHELDWKAAKNIEVHDAVATIRHAIGAAHEIDATVIVFVRPGSLPRTTSGKLRRSLAKQRYLNGELPVLANWDRASGLVSLYDRILLTRHRTDSGPLPQPAAINAHLEMVDWIDKVQSFYRLNLDGRLLLEVNVANHPNCSPEAPESGLPSIFTKRAIQIKTSLSNAFGELPLELNSIRIQNTEQYNAYSSPYDISKEILNNHTPVSPRQVHSDISTMPEQYPHTEFEVWLLEVIAKIADLPHLRIKPSTPLPMIGLDSLQAIRLVGQINEATGRNISLQTIFESSTISALATSLQAATVDYTVIRPIESVDRSAELPLSTAQERILAIEKLMPGTRLGNASIVLKLTGQLNLKALSKTISWIVARHEILRTCYREDKKLNRFVPVIEEDCSVQLEISNNSNHTPFDACELAKAEANNPIDPFGGPVFRAVLFTTRSKIAYLSICVHHIAVDATSSTTLWRDLASAYSAFCEDESPTFNTAVIQYVDFAAWETARQTREHKTKLTNYWRQTLAGAPTCLNLPFDRPRPTVQSDRAGQIACHMGKEFTAAVESLSKHCSVTPFVVLETGFALVCGLLTHSSDVVLGTVTEGRHHPDFMETIGLFSNTVALRHSIEPSDSAAHHLKAAMQQLILALQNSELAFDEVVAAIDPPRHASFDPLFQIFCQLRTGLDSLAAGLGDVLVEEVDRGNPGRGADVAVIFDLKDSTYLATISYSEDLFDEITIKSLINLYLSLIKQIAEYPELPIEQSWLNSVSNARLLDPTNTIQRMINHPPETTGALYPLSRDQEGLWFAQHAAPSGTNFTYLCVLNCPPYVNSDRLKLAIQATIQQCQSAWLNVTEHALQFVSRNPTLDIELIHLHKLTASPSGPIEVLEWHQQKTTKNDGAGFAVFITPSEVVVAQCAHHLFADGLSAVRYFELICQNYETLKQYPSRPLDLDRKFLPSLKEQQLYRWSAAYDEDMSYWHTFVDEGHDAPLINAIADQPHQKTLAWNVQSRRRVLPDSVVAALSLAAELLTLSPAELLTGITGLYLSRIADEQDVVFSVPYINRTRQTLKIPGNFVNLVPVRISFPAGSPINACLLNAAAMHKEALKHGKVAIGDIVRDTGLDDRHGDVTVNALILRRGPSIENQPAQVQGLTSHERGMSILYTQAGWTTPIELDVRFNAAVFEETTINRHLDRIVMFADQTLRLLATNPGTKIADVPIMGDDERILTISKFNDTAVKHPRNKTVVDMFCQQATLHPWSVAIVDDSGQLTYRELEAASNRMARYLIGLGVGPEVVVGVCLARNQDLIVVLLGILKAGGVYLPLDPDYPKERNSVLLDDSGATVIVTIKALAANLPVSVDNIIVTTPLLSSTLILLDDTATTSTISEQNTSPVLDIERLAELTPSVLAYIIYTSGSTGGPKGVGVPYGSLSNFVRSIQKAVTLDSSDVVLSITAATFDVSLQDFLLPLTIGACLVLADRKRLGENKYLANLAHSTATSYVNTTPSVWKMLLDDGWHVDRNVIMLAGAETLTKELAHRLMCLKGTLWNAYGPTETTVTTLMQSVHAATETIPIGSPLSNVQVYVVDRQLQPLPIGVTGELLIGGEQVTRGYLGRSGFTAEKFIADPFSSKAGARVYRTGDMVRWRANGTLEFIGRFDTQVKIRGMRVELGEIEAALIACEGISQAAVAARKDDEDNTLLVAYIVPDKQVANSSRFASDGESVFQKSGAQVLELDEHIHLELVRAQLKHTLPEHMIPTGFIGLTNLPLNVSGKLERKALPDVEATLARTAYVAPRSKAETLVAEAMSDLLGVDQVGAEDSFFDLGGHSLLAVRLVARLEATTGKTLTLRTVFETPTVSELGTALEDVSANWQAARPITKVDQSIPVPLSFQQERLWFLDRLNANSEAVYNIAGAVELVGPLDVNALSNALSNIVARHESLRTVFIDAGEYPVQLIRPVESSGFDLIEEDATDLNTSALMARVKTLTGGPFILHQGPLFRSHLLRVKDQQNVLVVTGHHTVLDGWSVGLLLNEVSVLYNADVSGASTKLPELPIQYADYTVWQRDILSGDRFDAEIAWWRDNLRDVPEAINLPFDRSRLETTDYSGCSLSVEISTEILTGLKELATSEGATLFMVLEAAFASLLHRIGGDETLVIGTAVAGRARVELERLVGFFVNTVALRHQFDDLDSFRDQVRSTKNSALAAFEHGAVPFEAVVEAVAPARTMSHAPLVQVMFVLQNPSNNVEVLDLIGIETTQFESDIETTQFELLLDLAESPNGLSGSLTFATQLFDMATAENMISMLQRILTAVVVTPDISIGRIDLLGDIGRSLIQSQFNNTTMNYPRDMTVVDLFKEQADERSEAIAVIDGNREQTYGDLDAASNRLAYHLIDQGVGPECVVGVCLEHSLELIVTLLGIWKAGGAYLPLDPDYPKDRINFMLEDGGANMVITTLGLAGVLPEISVQTIFLDDRGTSSAIGVRPFAATVNKKQLSFPRSNNLAYIIYTSGSTGRPKGVALHHKGLFNLIRSQNQKFGTNRQSRVAQFASIGFDVSISEIASSLTCGAVLISVPKAVATSPDRMSEFLADYRITQFDCPPAFGQLLRLSGHTLDVIVFGGETLILSENIKELPTKRIFNAYGPTETSITASCFAINDQKIGTPPPIGAPISNTQAYVVDEYLMPQPVGVLGELLIGGVQVGRGYVGQPGLTSMKFIADPFSDEAGARLYCTGDIARWRADGTLEFSGRSDFQVNIRGMRVELGEIEMALQACDGITQAVVETRTDRTGNIRLIAFMVPENVDAQTNDDHDGAVRILDIDSLVDVRSIRSELMQSLPNHMIPSGFAFIDRIPLTSSGKVDRKSLLGVKVNVQQSVYVAPNEEVEIAIASAFSDILDVEKVGIHDNFFDLGGHSLLIVRLVKHLEEAIGISLPLRAVFEAPSVAELAAWVHGTLASPKGLDANPLEDVDLAEELMPLGYVTDVSLRHCAGVLVTGATGFLGRYILKELLVSGTAPIYCLVRGTDHQDAERRLGNALSEISVDVKDFAARVHVVCGDLCKPNFGLEIEHYQTIASNCDVIVHNAADVNFVKSYRGLRTANVLSVVELMKLIVCQRPKAMHFISTISVFGDENPLQLDPASFPAQPVETGGYAQSKWVAEQILLRARLRGFPIAIHRPGLIIGDSHTGWYDTRDTGTALLSIVLDSEFLPDIPKTDIFAINVDQAASRIVGTNTSATKNGCNFHLFDHSEILVSHIMRAAKEIGIPLRTCSWDNWLAKANTLMLENPDHEAGWLIREMKRPNDTHASQRQTRSLELSHTPSTTETSLAMPLKWISQRRPKKNKKIKVLNH